MAVAQSRPTKTALLETPYCGFSLVKSALAGKPNVNALIKASRRAIISRHLSYSNVYISLLKRN